MLKLSGVLFLALPLCAQVVVKRQPHAIEIDVNGKPFTSFVFAPGDRKPYFSEFRSASGVRVTRGVPADPKAGESIDHPHQKGLYFAHGDVNGFNFWATEPSQVGANTGKTVVRSTTLIRNGFTAQMDLLDPTGHPLMEQAVTVTAGADGDIRFLDFDAEVRALRASTFRDSTEGILALRVASWMEQNRSGKIVCPSGEGESACWGKRAPWVGFSGAHNGETLGVAVLQHPSSLRFPTFWHVRSYGLLSANPFGVQHFYDERVKKGLDAPTTRPATGDFTLQPGQEARFRYRIVIHKGLSDVDALFRSYSAPETVFDKLPAARAIAVNARGALYASTNSGIVQVFGPGATGALIAGSATGLTIDSEGNLLAARPDGVVRILPTGETRAVPARCAGEPVAVAVAKGGSWVATSTAVCRIGGGVVADGLKGVRTLAVAGERLLVGDDFGAIWQVAPGELRRIAKAPSAVTGMAGDSGGTLYAGVGSEVIAIARDRSIIARYPVGAPVTALTFGVADRRSLWVCDNTGRISRLPSSQPSDQPAWAEAKRLRILSPLDGDILNTHDGELVKGGLKVTVRGEVDTPGQVNVNGLPAKMEESGRWSAEVTITQPETRIVATRGGLRDEAVVLWDSASFKRYRVSTDDNIHWLKDIAQHAPAYKSIFENPYLAMWREMHRKYGTKVHFNIYYETKGFNLSQMPDRYREEWRKNADWIRLSFHARTNDPDRPYVHSTAERIAEDYRLVNREIERFAGREVMSPATTIHWGEASPHAVQALRDAGVRILAGYFELRRDLPGVSYDLSMPQVQHLSGRDYWKDTKRGLLFVRHDAVLNDASINIPAKLAQVASDPHQSEIFELMIHEQHFYPGWTGYRPDYAQRVETAIQWVTERGYRPVFFEDGFLGAK